ncbi:MAG TPA: hypothetical protein VMO88_18030 [Acidimicrobiales bacterium]|nr:hypothetical protein [Acidimicrobiales bacterium]
MRNALLAVTALAATAQLAAVPAAQAATPPSRFVGQGTTYWEYSGNDGNGNLTVKFDTTEPGLAPNQADVTYSFDSGSQAFFVNSGQVVVTGDWVNGWNSTTTSPPSTVRIGPFGNGTNIPFEVNGYISVQTAGAGQGPWSVNGSFTPTQGF